MLGVIIATALVIVFKEVLVYRPRKNIYEIKYLMSSTDIFYLNSRLRIFYSNFSVLHSYLLSSTLRILVPKNTEDNRLEYTIIICLNHKAYTAVS